VLNEWKLGADDQKVSLWKKMNRLVEDEAKIFRPVKLTARSFDSLENFSRQVNQWIQYFHEKTLSEAVNLLVEESGYWEYLEEQYKSIPKQWEKRKRDVEFFCQMAKRFEDRLKNSYQGQKALSPIFILREFLERLLLQDNQDRQELKDKTEDEDEDVKANQVTLMTLHSSKGLEFDVVYLVGMEEEILPHKKTLREDASDWSEERRLAYVGITRARKELIMTYCKEREIYGTKKPRHPSRFVFPLIASEERLQHIDKTAFHGMNEEQVQEYKQNFFADLLNLLD